MTGAPAIIANAKPPVKHMPITPIPSPPTSSCSRRASARNHTATGLVLPRANTENSRRTQNWPTSPAMFANESPAPGVPNRRGSITVNPSSITSCAKATRLSSIPGNSWMMMTPGPAPLR
jgi:hypothetical protein